MAPPLVLDLFCCQGGGAQGYVNAGAKVVGVDHKLQKHYPFKQLLADALDALQKLLTGYWRGYTLRDFDLIHASPPCWAYMDLNATHPDNKHPRLIKRTRHLLQQTGRPYVIENIETAPLKNPITLCGTMFPGLRVLRHRNFESNQPLTQPPHPPGPHPKVYTSNKTRTHYQQLDPDDPDTLVTVTGGGNCPKTSAAEAMQIDWMTKYGLNQAIPPAYTEFIGLQLWGQHA